MNRTKVLRRLLLSLTLAASVIAAPAYARVSVNISVAPPAPQYEVVPNIEPGYAWAPGYWGWTGERHVWVRGHTIVQRDGYRWEPDRWDQRGSGYYRTAGYWQRDNAYRSARVNREVRHMDREGGDRGHRGENGHGNRGGGGRHGD